LNPEEEAPLIEPPKGSSDREFSPEFEALLEKYRKDKEL